MKRTVFFAFANICDLILVTPVSLQIKGGIDESYKKEPSLCKYDIK
jgi:hypothetical protein